MWNVIDFLYQYAGIANIVLQFITVFDKDREMDTAAKPLNVILLSCVLLLAGLKTMAWLRVFKSMSLLICMIKKAFVDLT
jgi:hypothetical protein